MIKFLKEFSLTPKLEYLILLVFNLLVVPSGLIISNNSYIVIGLVIFNILINSFLILEFSINQKYYLAASLKIRSSIFFIFDLTTVSAIIYFLYPPYFFMMTVIFSFFVLFYNFLRLQSKLLNIIPVVITISCFFTAFTLNLSHKEMVIHIVVLSVMFFVTFLFHNFMNLLHKEKLQEIKTVSNNFLIEIENTQKEVIYKLSEIAETRSRETGNHVKRVAEYCNLLAKYAGLKEGEINLLHLVSPMHDVGKLGVPERILAKPGRLDDEERLIINTHTTIGYDLLKNSDRDIFRYAAIVAYQHHEYWNGNGYPNKLSGKDIHIFGRISAVVDVFDALSSDRCYKKAWPIDEVLTYFKEQYGKQFDPDIAKYLVTNINEFVLIKEQLKDIYE